MTTVRAGRYVPATEMTEGAGVTVHRTIGSPAIRNHDPFMLLDQISSDDPDDYVAGFPPHPHRGFNTFTYMIDGDMEHRDSMGNTGNLGPGGAQWMKAASGVIHSEMPKQENGLMRGFQLWINLPAANKMDAPAYQEYKADAFPVIASDGVCLKLVVGTYGNAASPIIDDITGVRFLDVSLQPGVTFTDDLQPGHNRFVYLFEGGGVAGDHPVNGKILVTLLDEHFEFTAGESGARFLLVSGRPIGEKVVQYGPFVMSTREEIEQAMRDYNNNSFVRDKAWINRRVDSNRSKTGA